MHLRSVIRYIVIAGSTCAVLMVARPLPAQNPPRPTQPTQAGRGARQERAPDYPVRPPVPPEQLAHGQQLFRSNCSFCHGSDARGGETGPNLVRDRVVLSDQHGETITPIVQNGIPDKGMPKFALSATDIASIADWLHAQPLSDRGSPSMLDVLAGNATAGQTYFSGAGRCTECHSATGDLAGIGGKYDAKTLQNLVVSGGGFGVGRRSSGGGPPPKVPPTTVTVTLPSGQTFNGTLDHISAFVVALRDTGGSYRSFARQGSVPKVVVTNPLQWHLDMLPKWKDTDIHNVTAYLATLK
jgi:mono/diheme cytochrome c family protein